MYKPFTVLIAALGLTLLTACGSSYGERCDMAVQCSGGNDRDVDACVVVADANEEVAAAYDCLDAYFKLDDCIESSGVCTDKRFETNCKDQGEALKKCEEAASGR
jgi:hypothetical protein